MFMIVGSSPPEGSSQEPFWDIDMPTTQPLAQSLCLWVEPSLIGDTLSEDVFDDEVHRPQIG
jgi:hypothetical protein